MSSLSSYLELYVYDQQIYLILEGQIYDNFLYFPVPSAPRHLTAELTQQDPPQVHVSWQKPEHINGRLIGYKIFWAREGQPYEYVIISNPKQQFFQTKILGNSSDLPVCVYMRLCYHFDPSG